MPVPREAADRAVMVRVEGWDVPQELRVLVQVTPTNAPFVVASVGGLGEIEDRVVTPMIRSVVRNVVGSEIVVAGQRRATRVLDLVDQRDAIETTIERLVREEALKAGLEVNQLRFGESVIPPELLVARRREQLAQQLRQAYQQETIAQEERVKTEQARATADQQRDWCARRSRSRCPNEPWPNARTWARRNAATWKPWRGARRRRRTCSARPTRCCCRRCSRSWRRCAKSRS